MRRANRHEADQNDWSLDELTERLRKDLAELDELDRIWRAYQESLRKRAESRPDRSGDKNPT